jgi:glycerophosphoryl diester phosphodiesterase
MPRHIEVVVHRGLNQRAPENTLAGARLCAELGLDYVEVDVRTSRDGVFHILHDPTVNRTSDGSGPLAGMSAAEIARLDAGSWFGPAFAGERIPRLDEFLRWAQGRIKVYLDIKQAHPAHLLDLLCATDMARDCFLFCEQPDLAETLRALDSEITLMATVRDASDLIEARERLQAQIAEIEGRDLSDELVTECHARGHRVMVYTQADDPALFRRIMASGADLVNLDQAETWLRVAQELAGS